MLGTMSMRQPENWLYEIWQKGQDSPCYVMVPNAKDLVKSHLMIAVREEVEVLKEKISELMDKINQLEVENTILKSNMSQETLQQLQTQLQITGSTPTNGTNMLTAAPTPAAITAAPTSAAAVTAAAANAANTGGNATATNSNNTTASAAGSGTATPTTQQPSNTGSVEQNVENNAATQNEDNNQGSAQTSNGPMS